MAFEITWKVQDGIFLIILNRPQRKNAISDQMMEEIMDALKLAEQNKEVRAVVMTGAGEYYSSGYEVRSMSMEAIIDYDQMMKDKMQRGKKFVESLINFPKLLIAFVNGPAIGIAVTTLALFDIVYAQNGATFQTPFAALGFCAEGCSSYTFPRIMGTSKAGSMLYGNYKMNAFEAKECGLISEIFKHDEVNSIMWPKIFSIGASMKGSLLATKKLIRKWNKDVLIKVNQDEWEELDKLCRSQEFIEALFKRMQRAKI